MLNLLDLVKYYLLFALLVVAALLVALTIVVALFMAVRLLWRRAHPKHKPVYTPGKNGWPPISE